MLSWADCNDEEAKENEEEVKEEKETGQREMTDERPPGLEGGEVVPAGFGFPPGSGFPPGGGGVDWVSKLRAGHHEDQARRAPTLANQASDDPTGRA